MILYAPWVHVRFRSRRYSLEKLAARRVDTSGSRLTKLLFTFDAGNRIRRRALSRVREDCTRLGNYFV